MAERPMTDLAALRALAETVIDSGACRPMGEIVSRVYTSEQTRALRAFERDAGPAVVLALIAELETARKVVAAARHMADEIESQADELADIEGRSYWMQVAGVGRDALEAYDAAVSRSRPSAAA